MISHIMQYQAEIVKALLETGFLIGVSTLSAILIGLPLGTLIYLTRSGGVREHRLINTLGNIYVNVVRSFPFLIFVVAMIPVTRMLIGKSIGTLAASIPLSFVAIAIFARFVEQSLLEVPDEITDTALSMGATTKQLVLQFLYVEARSGLILGLTSSIISFISYSTVMGVVGGGGIGDFAMRYGYQRFDYVLMYATVIIMVLLVQIIQFAGTQIGHRLNKR
ncbi:ABC transporter permease [Erysipelothrix sp. HDW6C]|uniref:methionine ABC transporter permease n=1 Tax=Erysipelothrix sp. HDW6C TaxID=2714930 RepID=UPI0014077FE6|nr:methionine ABC transporter permease [Erysipelothrix sp. HDW6C]QIK69609.1 ABC transporter permease [Erysipelothrix sp. HDW6C]